MITTRSRRKLQHLEPTFQLRGVEASVRALKGRCARVCVSLTQLACECSGEENFKMLHREAVSRPPFFLAGSILRGEQRESSVVIARTRPALLRLRNSTSLPLGPTPYSKKQHFRRSAPSTALHTIIAGSFFTTSLRFSQRI